MRILYPTDFSEASLNAFVYALQLAQASNASIVTFHAYRMPDISNVNLPHTLKEVYNAISHEEFENYKDSIPLLRRIMERHHATDVKMNHVLQQGEPKTAILNAIKANHADLVVMGTTGAGMMKKFFFGSVAAEVMENASVPVLAVPVGASFHGKIRKVAFATEMLDQDEVALPRIREISRALGAEVVCVNADVTHTTPHTDRDEEFQAKFPDVPLIILDSIDVEMSIRAFVKEQHVDILAMLIHRRSRLQELFSSSMTKQFASHLRVPILAIQAHTL
jgi:nucleotide-binding universal stress UspA family protein